MALVLVLINRHGVICSPDATVCFCVGAFDWLRVCWSCVGWIPSCGRIITFISGIILSGVRLKQVIACCQLKCLGRDTLWERMHVCVNIAILLSDSLGGRLMSERPDQTSQPCSDWSECSSQHYCYTVGLKCWYRQVLTSLGGSGFCRTKAEGAVLNETLGEYSQSKSHLPLTPVT